MPRPRTYLIRMLIFLTLVGGVCLFLFPPMQSFFLANAALNGLILGVLALGIVYNFRQVVQLYPEVSWIENFRRNLDDGSPTPMAHKPVSNPRLLAPMAAMISNRNSLSLSAMSLRSLLDGIASRLDESRDLSRYTIGLLIFLGLLGTFWGLPVASIWAPFKLILAPLATQRSVCRLNPSKTNRHSLAKRPVVDSERTGRGPERVGLEGGPAAAGVFMIRNQSIFRRAPRPVPRAKMQGGSRKRLGILRPVPLLSAEEGCPELGSRGCGGGMPRWC